MKILIKTSRNPKHEFDTQTTLYRYFPKFIARPIKLRKNRIYMKFYKKKSLDKLETNLKPIEIRNLVNKVKYILNKIRTKFPLFRHNDLHLGNILLDDQGRVRLTDFELTRLTGKTPRVIPRYGITNKINKKYDLHSFLNSLRQQMIKKGNKRGLLVLNKFLPRGYRGKTDTFVRNYRLRA